MRAIKLVLSITLIALFTISVSSCKKCKNEDPRARIVNNGTKDASVQIKTSGGNTENINNVPAGTTSEYRSYAPGTVTFTISVDQKDFEKTVQMEECFEYDIAIDANNNVTSIPTDRNE